MALYIYLPGDIEKIHTGCRVKGKNYFMHVFCNPFFTAYFTRKHKSRLTLLEILCRDKLQYAFNEEAYKIMIESGLANKWHEKIKSLLTDEPLTRKGLDTILQKLL